MVELLRTPLGRLRILAFAEGVSFLLILFVTMPLKYGMGMADPNYVVGLIHGLLFVMYVGLVLQVKITYDWSWKKTFWAWLASIVPFGTFIADKRLFREGGMES